jgi:peptidoglycan DL-endopeptidase CwlO
MKQRSTTPVSKHKNAAKKSLLITVAVLMAIAAPIQIGRVAQADQFDDRINAIQAEIDQYQAKAAVLQGQADSLQKEVSALTAQKDIIQGQINLKQAEHDKLVAQIKENEQKIVNNQDALGDTIANIYVDDKISPLEMLASSQSISDYVDKQEYRSTVRDSLTETIDQIRALKRKLEVQKKDVDRVLAEQQFARNALAEKESQRQGLLNQTRGQEAAYQQLSNSREQQKLQVQQAQQAAIEAAMRAAARQNGGSGAINILPGDPNKGGYPWEAGCYVDANAWSHGGAGGDGTDPLGYGCRQCVSYTAWKVGQRTGNFPRYWGNANQWPGSARAAGYSTGSTPRVNSVGVISAGAYGHVVWIEAVNGDGTVDISQYNYYNAGGPGWGNYSKMRVSAATYDTYIYF